MTTRERVLDRLAKLRERREFEPFDDIDGAIPVDDLDAAIADIDAIMAEPGCVGCGWDYGEHAPNCPTEGINAAR